MLIARVRVQTRPTTDRRDAFDDDEVASIAAVDPLDPAEPVA